MGAIQKQIHVEVSARIGMAVLNPPANMLHAKLSNLYQIVAVKGVFPIVDEPETRECLSVHNESLPFSSTRLRDEVVPEPFVAFDVPLRSVSNSTLHELFGEGPREQPSMPTPTPLHETAPTPGSLDFLDSHGRIKNAMCAEERPGFCLFLHVA